MRPFPRPLCLLTLCLAAAPVWAEEPLPTHPANVTGQFDNGLKYVIRQNATPPGRVTMYLHVRTGALNETTDQNGIAHFLEHMAFNGSTHFPPGTLVPELNKLGMTFGSDTNAHTNYDETVYKLKMPGNDAGTIDYALKILSDYAYGMTLEAKEIDDERSVILEELRSRRGAGERIRKQVMAALYGDTRLVTHDVIGSEENIAKMPRDLFVDYYNTWYRPENMTLIVAGDVKADDVIAAAKPWLGTFTAKAPAREPMQAGLKPSADTKAFVFTDPEINTASVEFSVQIPPRPPVKTVEQFRERIVESLALGIVNRRFNDRVTAGDAPFTDADVSTGDFLREVQTVGAEGSGQPQDWNKVLNEVTLGVHTALNYGFTTRELDLMKTNLLAGAEQAVKSEATADSTGIVESITNAVGNDAVLLSARQRLDLAKRVVPTITVEELHQAFNQLFDKRQWTYLVVLPSDTNKVTPPTPDEVLKAATLAWSQTPKPPADQQLAGSVLEKEPTPGVVTASETDPDLQITNVRFANGVILHHKFSDYKKDQATVRLTFPGGLLEETAETRGLSDVASLILARPTTARHNSTQIRDLMAGKTVGVSGGISGDALTLGVGGNPKDLADGMRLAYALLTEGRLDRAALADWRKNAKQALIARKLQAGGYMQDALTEVFLGNDVRFRTLTPEQIDAIQPEAAEAWYRRITGNAAIEVAITGDITLEAATDLVARYVGSLPQRTNDFKALDAVRKLDRGPGPYVRTTAFETNTPQAVITAGFVSCDQLDPDRRPLALAAEILSTRMIERIREKDRLVYSIGCQNQPGSALPGTGILAASCVTDPQNADKVADLVLAMIRDVADNGVTDAELAVAKKQMSTDLITAMRSPGWWLSQIDQLEYRGRPLSDLKQLPGVFDTFTTADIQNAVKQYAKDEGVVRFIVLPKAKEPATQATQPAN